MPFLNYLSHVRERALNSPNLEICRNFHILIVNAYVFMLSLVTYIRGVKLVGAESLMITIVIIDVVLCTFSIISLLSVCFGASSSKLGFRIFMMALSVMLVLLLIVIVSIYVITSGGDARVLRKRVIDGDSKWDEIKTSLIHHNVCNETAYTVYGTTPILDEFRIMRVNFSSIQSGCCKPADECNFAFVSPIEWTKPVIPLNSTINPDCNLWHNDDSTLCFDCGSCKAGFIDKLKTEWRNEVEFIICHFTLLLMGYCIGCCVLFLWPCDEKKESESSAPCLRQLYWYC